ncbi:MAG: histidine kinase [Pseudonocardia sp.]|nr:histidine kinase [Pseudonocardia sp.]
MRRRLLVIVLFLVVLLLVGLGLPLALSDARSSQQRLFVDRLTDTVFFASIAQRPVTENDPLSLQAELTRHDQVYGVVVAVVGRDGQIVVASRPDPGLDSPNATDRVRFALANRRSEPYPLIMPWDSEPMVLAEPVLVDGEVRGAAVTVSPTGTLRAAVLRDWLVLLGASLLVLGLAVFLALPVVRWILRPVQRLDEGTGRVAAAVLAGGSAEPVADGRGPPELRRLSTSFDRMATTVTQALQAQRAFVADASHQLRNPLTALRLRLHNLEDDVRDGAVEEHVAAMEEVDRLAAVLDGLLALARAEQISPATAAVDLDTVLADRLDAWQSLANHEGLTLSRIGPPALRVQAPSGAVEAVLDAVLDNAVKFSRRGGVVEVSTRRVEDQVELAVRDSGPGMRPEELSRATDRFWRSPEHHNLEGCGLGLAIAERTAQLAGGSLLLELPAGGGLRVVIRLPSAPATAQPGEPAALDPASPEPGAEWALHRSD